MYFNISSTVNIGCSVKKRVGLLGISLQKRRPVDARWKILLVELLRKLGVDLQYRKSSAKPWLTNITDGLILQWNQVRQRWDRHWAQREFYNHLASVAFCWYFKNTYTHTPHLKCNCECFYRIWTSRYKKSKKQDTEDMKSSGVEVLDEWIRIPSTSNIYIVWKPMWNELTLRVTLSTRWAWKVWKISWSQQNKVYMFTMHAYSLRSIARYGYTRRKVCI